MMMTKTINNPLTQIAAKNPLQCTKTPSKSPTTAQTITKKKEFHPSAPQNIHNQTTKAPHNTSTGQSIITNKIMGLIKLRLLIRF